MKIRTSGGNLVLAMAFLAAVCGCERSTEPTASNLGTIEIQVNMPVAPWVLAGPRGVMDGAGSDTLTNMAPGRYTIIWSSVSDYSAPVSEDKYLQAGGDIIFGGNYIRGEFVVIPAGTFWMGAQEGESGAESDEYPRHQVTLTHSFYLQSTEVTNQQYLELAQWAVDHGYATATSDSLRDALDGSTVGLLQFDYSLCEIGCIGDSLFLNDAGYGSNPDNPVGRVSWYGAAAYCDWLSLQAGLPRAYDHATWQCNGSSPYEAVGCRLPTEAEWEYACRAGTTTPFNTGECLDAGTEANYDGNHPYTGCTSGPYVGWTVPVGSYTANAWGLYDMHGNSMEMCNDWYSASYYGLSPGIDPVGGTPGDWSSRVRRGGSRSSYARHCRTAGRLGSGAVGNGVGFRPARSAD